MYLHHLSDDFWQRIKGNRVVVFLASELSSFFDIRKVFNVIRRTLRTYVRVW